MNETIDQAKPFIPAVGEPNSIGLPATRGDQAVAVARDIPTLIKQASVVDPDLAAKWTGKALVASKTVWGTLATMMVSWAVTRWGLGWDPQTCAEASGVLVMAATLGLRSASELPITGLFTKASPHEAAVAAAEKP